MIKLWHGTTDLKDDRIGAEGLRPQAAPLSAFRGNLSTLRGYTERMVYLGPVPREAWFYAKAQAHKLGGKPIIYEATMSPDDANFRPSDDLLFDRMYDAALIATGWGPFDPTEDCDCEGDTDPNSNRGRAYLSWRTAIAVALDPIIDGQLDAATATILAWHAEDGELTNAFADPQTADRRVIRPLYTPSLTLDRLHPVVASVRAALDAARLEDWRAGLATDRDPSVAYEGVVPPARLRRLTDAEIRSAQRDHDRYGRGRGHPVAAWSAAGITLRA